MHRKSHRSVIEIRRSRARRPNESSNATPVMCPSVDPGSPGQKAPNFPLYPITHSGILITFRSRRVGGTAMEATYVAQRQRRRQRRMAALGEALSRRQKLVAAPSRSQSEPSPGSHGPAEPHSVSDHTARRAASREFPLRLQHLARLRSMPSHWPLPMQPTHCSPVVRQCVAT